MFRKLENLRLKFNTAKSGKVIAAAIVGTGVLAGTAMSVNGAPLTPQFAKAAPHEPALAQLHDVAWRGRGGASMLRDLSEEQIEKRLDRMVQHLGVEVEATPEQEAAILAILKPVALEMKAMVSQIGAPGNVADLLLADDIDRDAVETLRAERLALADTASRKMVSAVIEIAAVLSPEQRAMLAERIEELRAMRSRWH